MRIDYVGGGAQKILQPANVSELVCPERLVASHELHGAKCNFHFFSLKYKIENIIFLQRLRLNQPKLFTFSNIATGEKMIDILKVRNVTSKYITSKNKGNLRYCIIEHFLLHLNYRS